LLGSIIFRHPLIITLSADSFGNYCQNAPADLASTRADTGQRVERAEIAQIHERLRIVVVKSLRQTEPFANQIAHGVNDGIAVFDEQAVVVEPFQQTAASVEP
jgi:hypothetical protein